MRINDENETVDMELRDFNYILPAYVRSYMFYQKNAVPKAIIWPMFTSVTVNGTVIPVLYVNLDTERAKDIYEDGADIPEATEEMITKADEDEDKVKALMDRIAELEKELEEKPDLFEVAKDSVILPEIGEEEQPAITMPDFDINSLPPIKEGRTPKLPDRPAVGSPDGMQSRDSQMDRLVRKDLLIGEDLGEDDEKEIPFDKNISRDADGNPIVED